MLRLFRATPPTRTPVGYSSSFESQPNIRVAGTSRARPDPDSNKATETTSAAPLNNYQAHPACPFESVREGMAHREKLVPWRVDRLSTGAYASGLMAGV